MELFVYCFITLLVLGAADPNPQTATSSSLASVQQFGERLKTPEFTLYLTPDIVKALQDVKLTKKTITSIETPEHNSYTNEENYNHKIYDQQIEPEKSLNKNKGFVSRFFLPRDKDAIENQEKNDLAKFYLDSQKNMYKQFINSQQNNAYNKDSQIQINANSLPYIPDLYTNQEEVLLQEQLKQQWNSILDHNRAQLQGLSASRHQNERNNQSPPILIHSEVRITKHHPVPVYEVVDVPVPNQHHPVPVYELPLNRMYI